MFKLIALSFSILLSFSACSNYNDVDHTPSVVGDIVDSESWYSDMVDEVLEMRVYIPTPNDFNCTDFNDTNGTVRPCTLADINSDIDANDDYEPMLHVRIETDSYKPAPDLINASFEQKGKSTREARQKSYRIKLDENETLYRGERTFQLNKHPYDYSRVRNKLAFDLFKNIPHFTSLKTEFVHLDINDSEHNVSDANNSDYGLFTHVEKVGKEFLLNRGWDKDDNLWKAQEFSFGLDAELAIDDDGKPIDPEAFDTVLEIERGKDQTKLHEMLMAVNDETSDFEEVFEKYFNRNNYITWFAINLIMSNKDTTTQNFYLYSPLYSDTFYFLPWDYDGAGAPADSYAKWDLGYATWWRVPLHRRFLSVEKNRDDLDAMVNHLRENYITPGIIQERLDVYEPLITEYFTRLPDVKYEDGYIKWQEEFNTLVPRLDENINAYKSQLGHPMPFWQGATYAPGKLNLQWDRSVDLEGDTVVYNLKIATYPDMNSSSLVYEENNILDIPTIDPGNIHHTVDITLDAGTYYMQVISQEENNLAHYQIGFENYVESDIEYARYYGIIEFEVK